MDVANLLSHDPPRPPRPQQASETSLNEPQRVHQYPTRHSVMSNNISLDTQHHNSPPTTQSYSNNHQNIAPGYNVSPISPAPKNVAFELLFDGDSNHKARLPMRVQIWAHDTTDSIVTTVKNFYGLYEGAANGVSFEDDRGNTLIARYENFQNNMTVYVRVVPTFSPGWQPHSQNPASISPIGGQRMAQLDESFQMLPPQPAPAQILDYGQPVSRPASRIARKQSASPHPGRGRRSVSAQKIRSRSGMMSREGSFQGCPHELNSDAIKGYSSSDGEGGSVTSSRKARSEQLASAEISLDNILEGNRRKRAKFESSVSTCSMADMNSTSLITQLLKGTTPFCAAPSTGGKFNLFHLPSTTIKWSRKSFPICAAYSAYPHIQPAIAITSKLWIWRTYVWYNFSEQSSCNSTTSTSTRASPSRPHQCTNAICSLLHWHGTSSTSLWHTSNTRPDHCQLYL